MTKPSNPDRDKSITKQRKQKELLERGISMRKELQYFGRMLTRVYFAFCHLERMTQLALAKITIQWALASMAQHARRDDCESLFEAMIKWIHSGLIDESESKQRQLYARAMRLVDTLASDDPDLIDESMDSLTALNENSPLICIALRYSDLLLTFMDHASPERLKEVTMHAAHLAQLCTGLEVGAGVEKEQRDKILGAALNSCTNTMKEVLDLVTLGTLVVIDGKIVNPSDGALIDSHDNYHEDIEHMSADDDALEEDKVRSRDFLFNSDVQCPPELYPALLRKFNISVNQLDDPKVKEFLSDRIVQAHYAHIGAQLCQQLGVKVTDEQMWNIARLNLQPDEGVALTAQERIIANQLFFHALKDEMDGAQSDEEILEWAQNMVSCHIRGKTTIQKIGRWFTG